MKAGFLGVDVFLVISGYLISKNILNDLKVGQFSFEVFYRRRFKRLFPALFVTLLLSLIAGILTLAPVNLEQMSKSLISGVFFVSNIFFLNETGYFDTESAFKPLLHIWSLSLEEQFYFIWPLLLMVLFKVFRKAIFLIILILTAISLYAADSFNTSYPEGVFYLLPFRFFEFSLGALCIYTERFKIKSKIIYEFSLLLGIALILYSSTKFTMATPMPGVLSLISCIGAMLVIYGGSATYSRWLLTNRVMEIIGKSSYSIYLVHWPLIVYYKYYTLSELTNTSKVILGAVSLLLGFVMWKWIENTFRRSELKFGRIDSSWVWIPVLMVLISFVSWRVWINKGYPSRYSKEFTMTAEEILESRNRYWEGSDSDKDVLKGVDTTKNIIVMGNSFAIDLIYALRKNGIQANIISLQTSHRCFNFSGAPVNEEDTDYCNYFNEICLTNENWPRVEAIYLFDHWPKLDLENLDKLLKKIRSLSNAPIYVFGPKMVFSRPIPEIVHSCKSANSLAINNYAQAFADKEGRNEVNNALLKFFEDRFWEKNQIFFIDVLKVLGNDEDKYDVISSKTSAFLYFDPSHFTDQGAKEFGEKLKESNPEIFNLSR